MMRQERGFTLIELMVTLIIIGILAAFAIPQYLKSVETSKADDAVSMMNSVAAANQMYATAHRNQATWAPSYLSGVLDNTCTTGGACGSATVCDLVQCKYMAAQDFNSKPYLLAADSPGGNTKCNTATLGTQTTGGPFVACTARKTSANAAALGGSPAGSLTAVTAYSPYTGWGYGVNTTGQIYSVGTNAPNAVSQ